MCMPGCQDKEMVHIFVLTTCNKSMGGQINKMKMFHIMEMCILQIVIALMPMKHTNAMLSCFMPLQCLRDIE